MEKIDVLDKGFVELVDHLGNDNTAVKAARISYKLDKTPKTFQDGMPDTDKKLLELLMKNGHGTPFEHIVFTFYIKAPIFVARQWFRHRIGSFNERSGRYTQFDDEFYIPTGKRAKNLDAFMSSTTQQIYKAYQNMLRRDVKKEVARMILPLNIYTEWYWTVNARSLMNFLNLRADTHAQHEIRQYAITVAQFFEKICPVTYKAFVGYAYTGNVLTLKDKAQSRKDDNS